MEAGQMWREEVEAVHSAHQDIELEHMPIDTCAQLVIQDPTHFDVILTDNMFGDILSDVASALVGSVGYLPSVCLSAPRPGQPQQGLYEPLDATDFHLNGRNLCNPVGAFLAFAHALTISFDRPQEGALLARAVDEALATGLRTVDVAPPGSNPATTSQIGDAVLEALDSLGASEQG
jgi:3-isopropylmalate dehydrogenase